MSELDLGWEDVLRRARRRPPRRRLVFAGVVAVAALGGAPALGVLLTRAPGAQLPRAADRSNVAVAVQPVTGRVLVEVAPWRGRDGICYLLNHEISGCAIRSRHGAFFHTKPPLGYTFDARVASVIAILDNGKRARLRLYPFRTKLGVTFFVAPRFIHRAARSFELRDASGRVLSRVRLPH
ncbi:MAG TPA: hypothetical protein VGK79_01235 [Gaiellaceae bacterium]